jgi:ABC-type multidrug transport system ATPase subunit
MKSSSSPSWYILALILLNITSVSGDQTIPSGLFWTNFSVQTADGSFLVQEWSGFVRNGHICGVLGPSGAGKEQFGD